MSKKDNYVCQRCTLSSRFKNLCHGCSFNEDEKWVCPMCGGDEYGEKFLKFKIIFEGESKECVKSVGYECDKCSIQFGDPNRFNKLNRSKLNE